MEILSSVVCFCLVVASFIAGLKLDNYYHSKAEAERKYALERQFVRLKANADADDPVKPYVAPIGPEFMAELKSNGRAKTSFRKSDLTK